MERRPSKGSTVGEVNDPVVQVPRRLCWDIIRLRDGRLAGARACTTSKCPDVDSERVETTEQKWSSGCGGNLPPIVPKILLQPDRNFVLVQTAPVK